MARGFQPTRRALSTAAAVLPRRSALYLPGSNARALEKARSLPADVVILDLEDAVAPEAKALARRQVGDALRAGGFGRREVVVRINAPESEWGREDVQALVGGPSCAVLLPKAERVESVQSVASAWSGAAPPPIWCMIETPLGLLRAAELAAQPTVACLVAGTNDLAADLRCDGGWAERAALLPHLSQIVLAARAHGKACLDGVHMDLADDAGLEAACAQGRALGFDGKTLIHPRTLAAANRAFAPSAAEVERARRVVAAFEEARAAGSALVVLDGKLVEELHVRSARRLLALDAAVEAGSG